jgi:hypothetical protein
MSFHPEKCNVLSITMKRNPVTNCYILHGHQLEQQSAKYLGVSITSDMKWSEHIANICKKANNTLSFLKRNLNISNSNLKEDGSSFSKFVPNELVCQGLPGGVLCPHLL